MKKTDQSDILHHSISRNEEEYIRAIALARSYDPDSKNLLKKLSIDQNSFFLEIGAGVGTMAVWMSSLVKKVVAIDIDTTFLQEYHEIIDIRETPIESFADIQTYDIVYARFLLSCVNPREKIILKMVESLKSGGYLVIEDFDLITLYISDYSDDEMNKLHKKIVEAYIKTMIQLGWEPHLGSTLTRMVIESKLELIINEAKVKNRIGGEPASKIWKNSIQYWSDHICQNGLLSNDEISRYIELLNDPTFTFFSPMVVQIIARKK